jgi:hypothetical protein
MSVDSSKSVSGYDSDLVSESSVMLDDEPIPPPVDRDSIGLWSLPTWLGGAGVTDKDRDRLVEERNNAIEARERRAEDERRRRLDEKKEMLKAEAAQKKADQERRRLDRAERNAQRVVKADAAKERSNWYGADYEKEESASPIDWSLFWY